MLATRNKKIDTFNPKNLLLGNKANMLLLLSEEQLFAIMEAKKWSDIKSSHLFDATLFLYLHHIAEQGAENVKIIRNKASRTISAMMAEAPGYPLLMLWCLVGITQLGILPLTLFTFSLTTLCLVTLIIVKKGTEIEIDNEDKKVLKNLRLRALQIACANEYLTRSHKKVDEITLIAKPDKKFWVKTKDALETGLIVCCTAFTYYVGYEAVVVALDLPLLLEQIANPIGIGIALAAAIGLGLYVAFKEFEYNKNKEEVEKIQAHWEAELTRKLDICQKVKLSLQNVVANNSNTHDNAPIVSLFSATIKRTTKSHSKPHREQVSQQDKPRV